jgi:signal transduction histidine kinase
MILSIRFRLSASYVLLTLLAAAVVGALTLGMVRAQLGAEEEQAAGAQARRLADEAFQHFIPFARRSALQELASSSAELGGVQVRILGPDRRVLADSATEVNLRRGTLAGSGLERSAAAGLPAFDLASEPRVGIDPGTLRLMELFSTEANVVVIRRYRLGRSSSAPSVVYEELRGYSTGASRAVNAGTSDAAPASSRPRRSGGNLTVTVPVGGADSPLGFVEVTVASTLSAAATAATRKAVLYSAIGAVLVAAAFGVLMGQGMTVGLRSLTDTAAEMEKGTLSARARVRSHDEIGLLSQQFNRMAAQLETTFRELAAERDTLRRFVADASHELRTPLTALKTFNELLRNAAAADPRAREEFLVESHRQLERLEGITRNLLDLSRLDAGLVTPELSECEAGQLVAEACRLWAESAAAAGIDLHAVPSVPRLSLLCDRPRMEIVLSNLLSNAVRFTPSGGEIRLGADPSEEGGGVCFWITDTGAGIAEQDLPHVFERFYRGMAATGGGSGLGLAIVRSIAELHGGTATVSTSPGHGSSFRIAVPRRLP